MVTEIELLKEDIPRLELKFGAHNPFVELLKAQLIILQNPIEHQTQNRQQGQGFISFIKSCYLKRKKR